MSLSVSRIRLAGSLVALFMAALLPACTQASLSGSQADLAKPAATPEIMVVPSQAAAQPVAVSPTAAAESQSGEDGFTYTVDPTIASGATVERIPAVAGTSDSPYWLAAPEYRQVTLNGYPVAKATFKPQIFVYPVDAFKTANPEAAKVIDALHSLLQSRQADQELPFLPLVNAKQVLHVHVQYLDFQNGQGVRYLAQFDQGMTPINNSELIYTYQGLTRDGKYYVAAVLPVTHASLPADGQVTGQEPPEFTSDFPKYLANVSGALEAQPADSFTPNLAKLDGLISSLAIQ